jgi:hypothetical protein
MRVWLSAASAVAAAFVVATGTATAASDHTFHVRDNCLNLGAGRTVCFEAWGVDKLTTLAPGKYHISTHYHRRFTEFLNGVVTFEQRDMSHRVLVVKDGEGQVDHTMFVGWSTPSGLLCRWREQSVFSNGVVRHSVNDFSCSPS